MQDDPAAKHRLARNETLFRQVNERVKDVSEAFVSLDPGPIDFVCECGQEDCTEPIALTLEEYDTVRRVPTQFFVLPGHVIADIEQVVSERGRYAIVEKLPGEQAIARATDPRA